MTNQTPEAGRRDEQGAETVDVSVASVEELRAENELLREACAAYDWLIQWCMENAPKGLREMPWELYVATLAAKPLLANQVLEPGANQDSELEVEQ